MVPFSLRGVYVGMLLQYGGVGPKYGHRIWDYKIERNTDIFIIKELKVLPYPSPSRRWVVLRP